MENTIPLLGEKMPHLEVVTTQGTMNIPGDYAGKWFVLFSHPADYTPVCTTEFVAFQQRSQEFKDIGCELIGLSIDQVFSHIKWLDWIKETFDEDIEFPVIADDMGKVASTLGMVHPGKGTNTVRAVFIVDPEGNLRTMLYYPQEVGRNMDEILRTVKALQMSDDKGVACPAGWPNNEILGDRVIIPPATDHKTAKERKAQADCYDWWFCHKIV
ncbi:MAG: peroxiredoxin [Thermodesulfobacteriota bacterium]